MKSILTKLLTVKSIITLALTMVFCYLSFCENSLSEQFMTIYTVIIGFYFGTQSNKTS